MKICYTILRSAMQTSYFSGVVGNSVYKGNASCFGSKAKAVVLTTMNNRNNQLRTESTSAGSHGTPHTWNEASCVMAVAPMNNSQPYSLGFLLVERSGTGRVMPGNWVFPGGKSDPSDSNIKWISLFKDIGGVNIIDTRILKEGAKIPEMYVQPSLTDDQSEIIIPMEVSMRITAIREMFEEAGILLCKPGKIDPETHLHNGSLHYELPQLQDRKFLQEWQKKVRKNSLSFIELCKELNCVPDIYALHDWSNWLTPTTFKAKIRFDTINYMIILPKMPGVVIDGNEAVKAQWASPATIVDDHGKGQTRLMPPQVYEMSRLQTVMTIEDLQHRIKLRNELGIERFFPVFKKATDGTIILLPGDDMYPTNPEYAGSQIPIEETSKTICELKDSSKNVHRGLTNSDGIIAGFDVNITPRYGHVY